jgi:CRP-like cAMP-binding protein
VPGDIIGEMALLNGGQRTASVRARTDAMALEVSSAFFQASLGHMDLPAHKILRRVISGLADRLSEICDKIIVQMQNRAGEQSPRPVRQGPARRNSSIFGHSCPSWPFSATSIRARSTGC